MRDRKMKYAIVIPDGCADVAIESLGGKTPLEVADTPAMNLIAAEGVVGLSNNVPLRFPAGSEVANMSLLGYDPNVYFSGRAPIEAAAQGIVLGPDDWAIRCNTVTIQDQIMVDFTAGHVRTDECRELLHAVQKVVDRSEFEFIAGVSYRNLLIYRGSREKASPFTNETKTTAPHDLTDVSVIDDYPRGSGCDLLCEIMQRCENVLEEHPVNRARVERGLRPVTHLWLWGIGKSPVLPSFADRFGLHGAMITAVDLLRGLAALIGWDRIEVDGATGYLDTNYRNKGEAAVRALSTHDVVCVHIEAPDEASHEGLVEEKIRAIESIDRLIVAPLLDALKRQGNYRVLVMPDHQTPVCTKKHAHGYVPFAMSGKNIVPSGVTGYDEKIASESKFKLESGWDLMPRWIRDEWR